MDNSGAMVPLPSTPIIYDIKTAQWKTEFVANYQPDHDIDENESGAFENFLKWMIATVVVLLMTPCVVVCYILLACRRRRARMQAQQRAGEEEDGRDVVLLVPSA